MASTLLSCIQRLENVRKLKRKTTNSEEARIKKLEDRLDAAVAESRRMRHELATLQRRDQPAKAAKPRPRRPPTEMDTFNPDDTVN